MQDCRRSICRVVLLYCLHMVEVQGNAALPLRFYLLLTRFMFADYLLGSESEI